MEHGLRYLVGHGWSFFAKIVNVFYALTIFFMFSLDYSVIDYFDRVLNPANIYLFKVNNRNTRKRCEICSTLTIKTPEWYQWCHSGVFSVNFEHICWRTVNFVNFEQCWRTIEFDLIHLFIFHLGWGTLLCWGGQNRASQPICSQCAFSLPS